MMLQEIRTKANDLTKMVDSFVIKFDKDLSEKEATLTNKMKQYNMLGERERKIVEQEQGIVRERALLKKEQDAQNEKQRRLELKERDLDSKIKKVNELMQL